MACLVPQFKCPSSSTSSQSLPFLVVAAKARDSVYFRSQCVTTPMAVVANVKHLPSLEAYSPSLAATRPLSYVGALGPPTQTNVEVTMATKLLHSDEEEVLAVAAAEAIALARAAAEVARDAAEMAGNDLSGRLERLEELDNLISKDSVLLERVNLTEIESLCIISYPTTAEGITQDENMIQDPLKDTELSSVIDDEIKEMEYTQNIAARSGRRMERRARRARAAEKSASVIPAKPGSFGKKKQSTLQEIGYTDPLRYLRGMTNTTKLLTATEELELSEGIQNLLKLERVQEELAACNGGQPTFAQWAAAAGVDKKTLRKHLNHGIFCKDKMIKSNIRLVISIAKNYQGAGMNLQDLVQEGCRGLVKGAEKFDASKGFKFSTYAHWWIKQSVRKSLSEQSRTIRLPVHPTHLYLYASLHRIHVCPTMSQT